MRSTPSSYQRCRRDELPPELTIDRHEPDWDYSLNLARDWDYAVDAFNPLERRGQSPPPPSRQRSRRSRENSSSRRQTVPPSSSRRSRSSSRRVDSSSHPSPSSSRGRHENAELEIQNFCAPTPACIMEEPKEESLYFQTYRDPSATQPSPASPRRHVAANYHGQPIRTTSPVKKAKTPSTRRKGARSSSSRSKVVLKSSGNTYMNEDTDGMPPGCTMGFPFPSSTPAIQPTQPPAPASVGDIVEELSNLQNELVELQVKKSPTPVRDKLLTALHDNSNASQTRRDQLDAFQTAKRLGRDSPEALRIAYSMSSEGVQSASSFDAVPDARLPAQFKPGDSMAPVENVASLNKLRRSTSSPGRDSPDFVAPPARPAKKSVRFSQELVSSIKYRPKTLPTEYPTLFFSKDELDELERDRCERIYEEQFEIIHQSGTQVAVTFPVRRAEQPVPHLTEVSNSWSSDDLEIGEI